MILICTFDFWHNHFTLVIFVDTALNCQQFQAKWRLKKIVIALSVQFWVYYIYSVVFRYNDQTNPNLPFFGQYYDYLNSDSMSDEHKTWNTEFTLDMAVVLYF